VKVRIATGADAEAIERVRVRGWQVGYRHVFPAAELDAMPVDWSRWTERLEQAEPRLVTFVAERAGAVLGFSVAGPSSIPVRYGELHALYVNPNQWSQGIGRALIERAEAELVLSWDEALLWTLEDNPRTRRFYESAGWRADGVRSSFDAFGVRAPIVRYHKRLSSSRSRS
jgi:GNAT superfamily N-acetyltransferase